jgi:hypothetical protein
VKIYTVEAFDGTIHGAEFSLKAAKALGHKESPEGFEVRCCTISMPAREALRRELGRLGGFAAETEIVYTWNPESK